MHQVQGIAGTASPSSTNQLSMDGAHSLSVDSGAYVRVCPKSFATHATLEALPASWRGLDLRSASGKMFKSLESARGGVQRHGSAPESVHCEKPFVV